MQPFPGSIKNRGGQLRAVDKATLFLDEIGKLPIELQSKFLRVLKEKTDQRGSKGHVNVRIIATTNRKIKEDIKKGLFRKDLYYWLNVFGVHIAPLRERKEDIKPLAFHFLKKISQDMQKPVPEISNTNMKKLISYPWPGNVRELRNVIERSVITSKGGNLEFSLDDYSKEPELKNNNTPKSTIKIMTDHEITALSNRNTLNAIKVCDGKIYGKNGAASLLNIPPTTLSSRLKKIMIKSNLF